MTPSRITHFRHSGSPIRIQAGQRFLVGQRGFVGSTTMTGVTLSTTTFSRAPTAALNAY